MFCTEMRSKRFCNGDMFEQARQKGRSDDELTIPSSPKDWKFQFQNMETMTLKQTNVMELDPVGSTVRYEMMKRCAGSVQDTMRRQKLVIDDTAFMPLYIEQSGDLERCQGCLTD